jgi:hypothetical protein
VGVVRYESESLVLLAGNSTHVRCYYSFFSGQKNRKRVTGGHS